MNDQYRSKADDLAYEIRSLAGTGEIEKAGDILRRAIDLLAEATRHDRKVQSDGSRRAVRYVIDAVEEIAADIKCVQVEYPKFLRAG